MPIRKLFERTPSPRPDVAVALQHLARLAETHPELADLAKLHAALVQAAFAVPVEPPAFMLEATHAATKLAAGVPLLRGEPLALDGADLRARYLQLCAALLALPAGDDAARARRTALERLRAAVQGGQLDIGALAGEIIHGDPRAVAAQADQHGLDAGLAATLLRWTLLPTLEALAAQLAPLRERSVWEQGYCPTCGAWPLLAEQRGIEQTRMLRCGLCGSGWTYGRVQCPFCATRLPADLQYLYAAEQEAAQRVVTCERCHRYFKVIATLTATPTPQLCVLDLQTLHLDLLAMERAYLPPE
ncbi:formate dehydrogenase accessory protein FdhE [Kallotenue papyrolyticum]|uniref:formate dehydrogenase accessory protein FdhE n=1 Tax=Kallotenue papyrolyticum TaxID=1325125 RepID=UPI00047863AD|nr:formate dehydrogenase accessory protein FdhE [Kallotenue papyrolyticum]